MDHLQGTEAYNAMSGTQIGTYACNTFAANTYKDTNRKRHLHTLPIKLIFSQKQHYKMHVQLGIRESWYQPFICDQLRGRVDWACRQLRCVRCRHVRQCLGAFLRQVCGWQVFWCDGAEQRCDLSELCRRQVLCLNFYCEAQAAAAASVCTNCAAGSYAALTGSLESTKYPSNSSSPSASIEHSGLDGAGPLCTACAAGSYKPTAGSVACTLCVGNAYGSTVAAISNASCVVCPGNSTSVRGSDKPE